MSKSSQLQQGAQIDCMPSTTDYQEVGTVKKRDSQATIRLTEKQLCDRLAMSAMGTDIRKEDVIPATC